MNSLSFIIERLRATSTTQQNLATGVPPWVWSLKSLAAWPADVTMLDQLRITVTDKRALWRAAAATWGLRLEQTQRITRDFKREGLYAFRDDREKAAELTRLKTGAENREAIYAQGDAARAVWAQVDVTWTYDPDLTQSYLASLLASVLRACLKKKTA